MQKLYFIFIGLIIAAALGLIFTFGVAPRPVGVMKPPFFEAPEQIGAVMARRLRVEIDVNPVLAFGIMPEFPSHVKVLEGFLRTAWSENQKYDLIIKEPQMPPIEGLPPVETVEISFSQDPSELKQVVESATQQGKRVLIYTSTFYTTHLLYENPVIRFEKELGRPVLSLSTAQLALHRDEERSLIPPCVGVAQDKQGLSPLGCKILSHGRKWYRKKLDQNERFVATAEQHAQKDYLIYVHPPVRATANRSAPAKPAM